VTEKEATQIAALLNARNQLTIPYDIRRVMDAADDYIFRVQNGRVVAAVEIKKLLWYQAEIRHLTVDSAVEQRGYARNLFAEAESRAAARGFRVLQCTIRAGNDRSERFFLKAGFTRVSQFHNQASGNNVGVWHKVLVPAL